MTGGVPPPPGPAAPRAGELVRFVEPAGRRRARVGTVEREIGRGRHRGALVIRVAGEKRRYVLPPERLRRVAAPPPAAPPPPPARTRAPARPAPAPPSPAARRSAARTAPPVGEALRLFD